MSHEYVLFLCQSFFFLSEAHVISFAATKLCYISAPSIPLFLAFCFLPY